MALHPTLPYLLPSGIRDNHTRGSVGQFLKENIRPESNLLVVSAYFTIYAYQALQDSLDGIHRMRFLFGEPRFLRSLDPEKTDKKHFQIEDTGLPLTRQLQQKRAARDCAHWIQTKVEIRSVIQSNLLHGKMYHLSHQGTESAVLGSSNFTVKGLGLGEQNNIELNLELDSRRDIEDLKLWFEELWTDKSLVADVTEEVLQYLSQLYANNSPQFIYYKTLFHVFERYLSDQGQSGLLEERTGFLETDIWKALFAFQKDGVKGAINKILNHNGCILADSVGLGKTYEALAVIKFFELRNARVLVLCPKKLRENWTIYQAHNGSALNPFLRDRFSYTVLSHSDLSRDHGRSGDVDLATINWGNYDLVVIDESHNFRNNTRGRRDEDGHIITQSRYERLMDDIIKAGVPTKVLLLSATPVNNDLKDLRNQIFLLTEDRDNAFAEKLNIPSVKDTLNVAQRTFADWAKKKSELRKTSDLLEKLSASFFTLLDELTIARSRKHIIKYYSDTLQAIGHFPERKRPISIFAKIDTRGEFMDYDQLNGEISQYKLSLFNPTAYVDERFADVYKVTASSRNTKASNFSQAQREHYLIGMMKVNFLKRLESSVNSFESSMERTIEKISRLQAKLIDFQARGVAQNAEWDLDHDGFDAFNAQEENEDDDLRDAMEVGTRIKFKLAHVRVADWLQDLEEDRQKLKRLYDQAVEIGPDRDAKLQDLKRIVREKVEATRSREVGSPNRNQKVLVFTAFADTARYLYAALHAWAQDELGIHIALVTGGTGGNRTTLGNSDFNQILTNFSPLAKKRDRLPDLPQNAEIDLLIATDCISEGQNLQDCDMVVNYDIHWNPVRLIQRFGRIDRIGSRNASIQMVNFWPTEDLNKYIDLKDRVEARMALVDLAATNQDDLLNVEEITDLIEEDLKYRDRQLLRLKDEVLDLEDLQESVALNEFTLDDFRRDLLRYLESNRQKLQDAPLGLYAVVPPDARYPQISPGVVFCLRQKGDTQGTERVNSLQPYFLVYIRADGQVRYGFAQPKQILDMMQALCADRTTPYEELCRLFDVQTQDGQEMSCYRDLLDRAVADITRQFQKRNASVLTSGRGGKLLDAKKQVKSATDFDLITWLVISSESE